MTSPLATAAGTTRQRLAGVLGTLQQDPNIPPTILEIASGLARAIGPLFQIERELSTDPQLLMQARGVLQETLEKMQGVDQNYPGVGDATGAIAESLRTLFNALREAGVGPGAQPQPAPQPQPGPFVAAAPKPAPAPVFTAAPQPAPQRPPSGMMGAVQPAPFNPAPQPAPQPQHTPSPGGPHRPPSAVQGAFRQPPPAAAHPGIDVPLGPSGLPRLEAEMGVHSESNFYTDFLGDIRNKGGVFVATFHVLPAGSQCEVVLVFPGNLTGEVRGTVRWKREDATNPGLGVELEQAAPETWNLIDRFIRKREPIMHEA